MSIQHIIYFNSQVKLVNLSLTTLWLSLILKLYVLIFLWKKTIEKKLLKIYFFATDKVYNFERIKLKQLVTLATYKSFFNFDGEY